MSDSTLSSLNQRSWVWEWKRFVLGELYPLLGCPGSNRITTKKQRFVTDKSVANPLQHQKLQRILQRNRPLREARYNFWPLQIRCKLQRIVTAL